MEVEDVAAYPGPTWVYITWTTVKIALAADGRVGEVPGA
jgi:hypothetical protein